MAQLSNQSTKQDGLPDALPVNVDEQIALFQKLIKILKSQKNATPEYQAAASFFLKHKSWSESVKRFINIVNKETTDPLYINHIKYLQENNSNRNEFFNLFLPKITAVFLDENPSVADLFFAYLNEMQHRSSSNHIEVIRFLSTSPVVNSWFLARHLPPLNIGLSQSALASTSPPESTPSPTLSSTSTTSSAHPSAFKPFVRPSRPPLLAANEVEYNKLKEEFKHLKQSDGALQVYLAKLFNNLNSMKQNALWIATSNILIKNDDICKFFFALFQAKITVDFLKNNPKIGILFYHFLIHFPERRDGWCNGNSESKIWFMRMFLNALFIHLQKPITSQQNMAALMCLTERTHLRNSFFDEYRDQIITAQWFAENRALKELFFSYLEEKFLNPEKSPNIKNFISQNLQLHAWFDVMLIKRTVANSMEPLAKDTIKLLVLFLSRDREDVSYIAVRELLIQSPPLLDEVDKFLKSHKKRKRGADVDPQEINQAIKNMSEDPEFGLPTTPSEVKSISFYAEHGQKTSPSITPATSTILSLLGGASKLPEEAAKSGTSQVSSTPAEVLATHAARGRAVVSASCRELSADVVASTSSTTESTLFSV